MKIFFNRNYCNEKQKKRRHCIQIFVFLNLLHQCIFTFSQKPVGFLKERNQSISWKIEKGTRRSSLYQNNNGSTITDELGRTKSTFLEVAAYMSLKWVTTGVWEGRFCWIWVKIAHFFKNKNGGVEPKDFIV